jgi:hypothetical protein
MGFVEKRGARYRACYRALIWLPYVRLVDGSVVWMVAMRGGGKAIPSKQMLGHVNEVRRLLGVHGVDHCSRIGGPFLRRSKR